MATVIDSLVVMFGFDSKGLQQGASKAKAELAGVEKAAGKTEKAVEGLGKGLVALLSVIGGTMAIKAFVQDFIDTNAQLDRLSKNLDVGVSSITQWGNAVEQVGGSSQGLQGTLTMLSKAQTQLRFTGESSLIPYFSMMGISMAGVGGKARTVTDDLLDMASFAEGKDRPTMHNMFAMMGIDEGTINLLLKGRKELEITLARQKAYGDQLAKLTPAATRLQENIARLRQQFTLFGLELLQDALPGIEAIFKGLEKFGNWCRENENFIVDFLKVMTVGLLGLAIVTSPITLMTVAVLALGAAIALLWDDYQTWQKGGDHFLPWDKWKKDFDDADKAIQHLIDKTREFFGMKKDPDLHLDAKKAGEDQAQARKDFKAQMNGAAPASIGGGLTDFIIAHEGIRNKVYKDVAGKDTIGVGHLVRPGEDWSKGISNEQAKAVLAKDIAESQAAVDKLVKVPINSGQRDALTDFVFGFGEGKLAESTLLKKLNSGDYAGAQAEFGKWNKAKVNGQMQAIPWLSQIRAGEAAMFGGLPGASAHAAPTGAGASSASVSNSRSVNIANVMVYTQATDAKGIAQAFSGELDYLLTSQGNYGMVP